MVNRGPYAEVVHSHQRHPSVTVDRRLADTLVLIGLSGVALFGVYGTLLAYRRSRAVGQMMGGMMSGMITGPFWYAIGTILVVATVGGIYVMIRENITTPRGTTDTGSREPDDSKPSERGDDTSSSTLLDMLPDDERRVLLPVLESPGITQVALRDRSNFSKAKVSQTVSTLETRGLIYRERQGRTYRIYPSASLQEQMGSSHHIKDAQRDR